MKSSILLSIVLIVLHLVPTSYAQETDFFWSLSDLNGGAQNMPLEMEVETGDTGSLFLYYTSNGPSDLDINIGALLDVAPSRTGVIRFTNAVTFNFPILVAGQKGFGNRWTQDSGAAALGASGNVGTVTDSFINEWGAFTFFGNGMEDFTAIGGDFVDAGYDEAAGAFLFGRIDFEVVGETGCIQIQTGPGRGGIVQNLNSEGRSIDPQFGSAVISVGPLTLGDVNSDNAVDLLDVGMFVELLQNQRFQPAADVNCDGELNLLDVGPFVDLISGEGLTVTDPSVEDDQPVAGQLGDAFEDGFVNLLDVACFANFQTCPGNIDTADVNQDGIISLLDYPPLVEIILSIE